MAVIRLWLFTIFGLFIGYSSAETELVCPEVNGFFADALDCCVFYRCVAGQPYQFNCPSGTFFDPIDKICNWPREVEDCDSQGRRIYYENENNHHDGEKTFEKNPNAEPGPSYIPDSEPEDPSYIPDSEPGPMYIPDYEPEYPMYPDTDWSPGTVEEDSFVCPEYSGFFPHPHDCKRFFRCVDKRPFAFTCAEGTFFDQSISVCNFPERVSECDAKGNRIGTVGHNDQYEYSENANNPASSNNEMHATGFIPCSEEYSLHPHPKSCTKFIYCHKFKGLLFECPRGLNFDRKRLTCDFPQNAPC